MSFKIFFRQFETEMMKLAVDQVRDEFKQMAIEGERHGPQLALHGKDMAEHQQELENKEQKTLKLKMKKKRSWKMIFTVKKK